MTKSFFAQTIPDKMYLEKCRELLQYWAGEEMFDIYFCVILTAIAKVSFLEWRLNTF